MKPELAKKAFSFKVVSCPDPECHNAHIIGFDNDGEAFADITLTLPQVLEACLDMIEHIQAKMAGELIEDDFQWGTLDDRGTTQ